MSEDEALEADIAAVLSELQYAPPKTRDTDERAQHFGQVAQAVRERLQRGWECRRNPAPNHKGVSSWKPGDPTSNS
jgi:hypothetical protein